MGSTVSEVDGWIALEEGTEIGKGEELGGEELPKNTDPIRAPTMTNTTSRDVAGKNLNKPFFCNSIFWFSVMFTPYLLAAC